MSTDGVRESTIHAGTYRTGPSESTLMVTIRVPSIWKTQSSFDTLTHARVGPPPQNVSPQISVRCVELAKNLRMSSQVRRSIRYTIPTIAQKTHEGGHPYHAGKTRLSTLTIPCCGSSRAPIYAYAQTHDRVFTLHERQQGLSCDSFRCIVPHLDRAIPRTGKQAVFEHAKSRYAVIVCCDLINDTSHVHGVHINAAVPRSNENILFVRRYITA